MFAVRILSLPQQWYTLCFASTVSYCAMVVNILKLVKYFFVVTTGVIFEKIVVFCVN